MKTEINCPVLNSEKFSKEIIADLINSLEQLENTKNIIFSRLNTAFSERVNKLCNIKSRINRANKIISSYASITEAITLKSKYHYPNKQHNYYTPTIIDQNSTILNKGPTLRLNKIVLNDKSKLGTKSLAAKDKIVTYDKYLTFATQFNDIVNELDNITNQEANIRQSLEEFEPILNHVTNDFTFGNKMKIEYAKKQQYNPTQEINPRGNSVALQDYLNEKKEEEKKERKKIQEAPISIKQKRKIKKKIKRKKLIKNTNTSKINFQLPQNLGLGGIAELGGGDDEDEDNKEEKNEEEEEEEEDDNDNEIQNEQQFENQEEETSMPIDFIRHNNQSKFQANKTTPTSQARTANYQKPVYNSNANNNANTTQNTPVPNPPPQSNTFSNNIPQPPPQQVPQPPSQPRAPNPPPSVPSSSTIKVIAGNSGSIPPPPPPPPPPPVVPTIPSKAGSSEVKKASSGPEISLEDELAKAMKGLKKTVNVEIKEKPKELSMAEQIALSRNRLKKVSAPPPKKEVQKSARDLLSEQIKLRFLNLRKHEEENEDSDSDKSDD